MRKCCNKHDNCQSALYSINTICSLHIIRIYISQLAIKTENISIRTYDHDEGTSSHWDTNPYNSSVDSLGTLFFASDFLLSFKGRW